MRFVETALAGAFIIELEPVADERGFFVRSFCAEEFAAHGLNPELAQCNYSFNKKRGTLRGLHYQADPFGEAKLVRCTAGAIYDVIVDIRPGSPTFGKWVSAQLTAVNGKMIFAPEGFAHGFQTLADGAEIFYQMSRPYRAELARGIRFDDPEIGVRWPVADPIMSERDRALPLLRDAFGAGAPRAAQAGR